MGSPISSVVAEIVLHDLEISSIEMLPVQPLFYYRYVDNIVLAVPCDTMNDIKNIFNSLHTRL